MTSPIPVLPDHNAVASDIGRTLVRPLPGNRHPSLIAAIRYPPPCLLLILCACACTPMMSVHLASSHPQPLSPRAQCVLLEPGDGAPLNDDSIGVLSYYNDVFPGPADDRTTLDLQTAARRSGANLVRITSYTRLGHHYPNEKISATLYKVNNIPAYEKTIAWNSDRRLILADFKGRPDGKKFSATLSHSDCRIWGAEADFECLTSWIDSSSENAARLLLHEQGNFDLSECYNRQFRSLLRYQFSRLPAKNLAAAEKIESAYLAKRAEYDSLTAGGLDDARQSEWTKRIAHALANNTDTSFRIPPLAAPQSLPPPPVKASVYIIRPKRFTSSLPRRIMLNIIVIPVCPYVLWVNPYNYKVYYSDEMSTGRIPAHQYTYLYLDPGDNSLTPSLYKGATALDGPGLDMLLAPGKTYYLRLDMPSKWFGFYPKPRLVLISAEEGRKLLSQCSLAKPDNDPPRRTGGIF